MLLRFALDAFARIAEGGMRMADTIILILIGVATFVMYLENVFGGKKK